MRHYLPLFQLSFGKGPPLNSQPKKNRIPWTYTFSPFFPWEIYSAPLSMEIRWASESLSYPCLARRVQRGYACFDAYARICLVVAAQMPGLVLVCACVFFVCLIFPTWYAFSGLLFLGHPLIFDFASICLLLVSSFTLVGGPVGSICVSKCMD